MTSRSRQGFQTKIWGPLLWGFLSIAVLNYSCTPTKQEQKQYYAFFKALQTVLPCRACRDSTAKFYSEGNTKLSMQVFRSRTTLALWLWRLHHKVNVRLGKRCNLSFKSFNQKYEHYRAECSVAKHGCVAPAGKPKKRAVVVIMTEDEFADMGLKSSIVNLKDLR